jgi:H+/Cl- antiporter ClcA
MFTVLHLRRAFKKDSNSERVDSKSSLKRSPRLRCEWQLIFLSTLGVASGLSLGPELPLTLTAGMAGSYLGILTRQSVLQARELNLVAASSAVGEFFGFLMAAALFVLELPHRMGLQYFEALSPAIFDSIVAFLKN